MKRLTETWRQQKPFTTVRKANDGASTGITTSGKKRLGRIPIQPSTNSGASSVVKRNQAACLNENKKHEADISSSLGLSLVMDADFMLAMDTMEADFTKGTKKNTPVSSTLLADGKTSTPITRKGAVSKNQLQIKENEKVEAKSSRYHHNCGAERQTIPQSTKKATPKKTVGAKRTRTPKLISKTRTNADSQSLTDSLDSVQIFTPTQSPVDKKVCKDVSKGRNIKSNEGKPIQALFASITTYSTPPTATNSAVPLCPDSSSPVSSGEVKKVASRNGNQTQITIQVVTKKKSDTNIDKTVKSTTRVTQNCVLKELGIETNSPRSGTSKSKRYDTEKNTNELNKNGGQKENTNLAFASIEANPISPKSTRTTGKVKTDSAPAKPSDNVDEQIISEEIPKEIDDNLLLLSSWGLPEAVLNQYHRLGVKQMFRWQAECLCTGNVLNGGNLVYSAPTSAGKTLVAELLILKRVLETKRKALFILPFVSVTREKMFSLQQLYQDAGVRVSGFMGSYSPPGGFSSVDVAVCTIEKGNSLINRLLEDNKLHKLGIIVVDELHMVGDAHRGYLLELLLTKISYVANKVNTQAAPGGDSSLPESHVQIVGMSATLPNLDLLSRWLKADLYRTDYRPVPLTESLKLGTTVYDSQFKKIRDINPNHTFRGDDDHIIPLCLETILGGHSVLIFCPTKNWCEKLSETIAREFYNIMKAPVPAPGAEGDKGFVKASALMRLPLDETALRDVILQLQRTPVGLDSVLGRTVRFGVAYHHAGLTFDERDIIEGAFRQSTVKVLVATSTLSSGVNLPARRVIIRSVMFHGRVIDTLVYKQMVGRAGRKGVDTEGESVLVCKPNEKSAALSLMKSDLPPVKSCLVREEREELSSSMKRAILEIVVSGVASAPRDVAAYASCTMLAASIEGQENKQLIDTCISFLRDNEFVTLKTSKNDDGSSVERFYPTQLGSAVLASSMGPDEGLTVFAELQRARRNFVLEDELHVIYLVTPIYSGEVSSNIDWYQFYCLWEKMSPSRRRVAEMVGVQESFVARAAHGRIVTKTAAQARQLAIHRRFYTSLVLLDLVTEVPLNVVARNYNVNKGQLQSLQQSSATFAGMVTVFCGRLGWYNLELILSQFQNRLTFGVQRELCDLVRVSLLNGQRARQLYNGGYETVTALASADPNDVENLFKTSAPFQSSKKQDSESEWEMEQRKKARSFWLTGKKGVTEFEAAVAIIEEAKSIVQEELGGLGVQWKQTAPTRTEQLEVKSPAADTSARSVITEGSKDIIEGSNIITEGSNGVETVCVTRPGVTHRGQSQTSGSSDVSFVRPGSSQSNQSRNSSVHETSTSQSTSRRRSSGSGRLSSGSRSRTKRKIGSRISPALIRIKSPGEKLNTSSQPGAKSTQKTEKSPLHSKNKSVGPILSPPPLLRESFSRSPKSPLLSGGDTKQKEENTDNFAVRNLRKPSTSNGQSTTSLGPERVKKVLPPVSTNVDVQVKKASNNVNDHPEASTSGPSIMIKSGKALRKESNSIQSDGDSVLDIPNKSPAIVQSAVKDPPVENFTEDLFTDSFTSQMVLDLKPTSPPVETSQVGRNPSNLNMATDEAEDFTDSFIIDTQVDSAVNTNIKFPSSTLMSTSKGYAQSRIGHQKPSNPAQPPEETSPGLYTEDMNDESDDFVLELDSCPPTLSVKSSSTPSSAQHPSVSSVKHPKHASVSPSVASCQAPPESPDIDFTQPDLPTESPVTDDVTTEAPPESPVVFAQPGQPPAESPLVEFVDPGHERSVAESPGLIAASNYERIAYSDEVFMDSTLFEENSYTELGIQSNDVNTGFRETDIIGKDSNTSVPKSSELDALIQDDLASAFTDSFSCSLVDQLNGSVGQNHVQPKDTEVKLVEEKNLQSFPSGVMEDDSFGDSLTFSMVEHVLDGDSAKTNSKQNFIHSSEKSLSKRKRKSAECSRSHADILGKQKKEETPVSANVSHNTSNTSDCLPPTPPDESRLVMSPCLRVTPIRSCKKATNPHPHKPSPFKMADTSKRKTKTDKPTQSDTANVRKNILSNATTMKADEVSLAQEQQVHNLNERNVCNERTSKVCNQHSGSHKQNSRSEDEECKSNPHVPLKKNTENDKDLEAELSEAQEGPPDVPLTQESFTIIDVCADRRLFETFLQEWRDMRRFSLCVACEKPVGQKPQISIGRNFIKKSSTESESVQSDGIPVPEESRVIVGLAVSWENRDCYYITFTSALDHVDPDDTLAPPPPDPSISQEEKLQCVQSVLKHHSSKSSTVLAYDVKSQFCVLARGCGLTLGGRVLDPRIASWLLDPGAREKNLQGLVTNLLLQEVPLLDNMGGGQGLGSVGLAPLQPGTGRYRAAAESVLTAKLMDVLLPKLKSEGLEMAFRDVEMPVVLTMARMELNGFGFSEDECNNQKTVMEGKLSALENQAYELAGHPFSLSATDDVGQVLFFELRLPVNGDPSSAPATKSLRGGSRRGRGKSSYSTSKDVLEKLKAFHPLPGVILEWRRICNALTKQVFPLQKEKILCEQLHMHRIYGECQLHTATGRVSMSEPNLQNIPKDFEISMPDIIGESPPANNVQVPSLRRRGGNSRLRQMLGPGRRNSIVSGEIEKVSIAVSMRHAFVPFKGGVLLAADYSQLELRIIAHLSQDKKLISVLNADGDVFKLIAAQWKNSTPELITKEERAQAKQVCYGMLYGIGPKALGEQLGVDENEASVFVETFKSKYPGLRTYLRSTVEFCRQHSYVKTMTGRKRYLPAITDIIPHARAQAERQAVNTTVQGSAADLVKKAMICVEKALATHLPHSQYSHRANRQGQDAHASRHLTSPPRGAFLVLQLHDELIYEVSQGEVTQAGKLIQYHMENATKLSVKLPVKVKVGPSWGKLEDVTFE